VFESVNAVLAWHQVRDRHPHEVRPVCRMPESLAGRAVRADKCPCMARASWAVEYQVDPSAVSAGRIRVGAKVLSRLQTALCDLPVEGSAFEVGGDPVEGHREFRRVLPQR
jgi:hypothetical protein